MIYGGFTIKKIPLKHFTLKKVFLKFDGKLSIIIDEIEIKPYIKTDNPSSLKAYQFLLFNLDWFETIQIKKVTNQPDNIYFSYDNETIFFHYQNIKLLATSKLIAKGIIQFKTKILFKYKNEEIVTDGTLTLHLKDNAIIFEGDSMVKDIALSLKALIQPDQSIIKMTSEEIPSIEPLRQIFDPQPASEWIYDRIKCGAYRIDKFNLHFDENFQLLPELMSLKAYCLGGVINYEDNAPIVDSSRIDITIKKENLSFKLYDAHSDYLLLKGSKVSINNLFKTPSLLIELKSPNARFDDKIIKKILKAYEVDFPLKSTPSSAVKTELNISLPLINQEEISVDVKGTFKSENIDFSIADEPFYSDRLSVALDNSQVIINDINLSHRHFGAINTTPIVISLEDKNLKGEVQVDRVSFYDKTEHNNQRPLRSNLMVDFETLEIDLADINLNVNVKDRLTIKAQRLEQLALRGIFSEILEGDMTLIYDENRSLPLSIKASLKNLTTPFIADSKPIKALDLEIRSDPKNTIAYIKNEHLDISLNDQALAIQISALDVNLSRLMESELLSSNQKKWDKKITIASNGDIFANSLYFDFDQTKVTIDESNNISFVATKAHQREPTQMKVKGNIINGKMSLIGTQMRDNFLNGAIGHDLFQNGEYSLTLSEDDQKDGRYYGTFEMKDGVLKDAKLFNTIFSILNISPTGLNLSGFAFQNGKLLYTIEGDNLIINPLRIDGKGSNMVAKGLFNLAQNEINLYVQVSILDTINTVINELPIINYIILGEDKKMSVNMVLQGDIKNPSVSLDNKRDLIQEPFNIIVRTLRLPGYLLEPIIKK